MTQTNISPDAVPYLFYLHGQIVEGSDGGPISPEHGQYNYIDIVETFTSIGFEIRSEIRPKNTNALAYARKVAAEIRNLQINGIADEQITVVGASKGGTIAAHIFQILKSPHIRYIILAGLFPALYEQDGVRLFGEVLSIHDSSDKFPISPELFFRNSPGLTRSQSMVTKTGLGHGLIYQAYPIWLEEVLAWCGYDESSIDELVAKHRGSRY